MTDPLAALGDALRRGSPPDGAEAIVLPREPSCVYAVSRFFLSWAQAGCLGADQAVLLRQALRWSKISSLTVGPPPAASPDFVRHLAQAGVDWDSSGELHVRDFSAPWLKDSESCDKPPVLRAKDESFPAEAFLESVGYGKWRSQAQKEAAWFTLQAPPGSTRVVVLPTGSGKSLCFQLLPRFSSGLTVVVVPTIALAMDQQINAEKIFAQQPDVNPVFFAADEDAEAVLSAVKEKRTRLVFTSPEACVSGRLRPILDKFAKVESGWFASLVVDEAHLIETWGAQFRVEFQILAASRRSWLAESGGKLRTFLFSATMSPRCREVLLKMFSNGDEAREFVCQRLRPEIRYYSRAFPDKAQRDDAAVAALWHLPRPAILYVTEVDDAEILLARLRVEGFGRVESFHGNTRGKDRRKILARWKNNELDLIVATSAFGVGVDKPDVRAVVHACCPENLDRYYQEVGRGGRDGWSSVSLLLNSPRDRKVAAGIAVKLLSPDLIQQRWAAMFDKVDQSKKLGDHIYAMPVASRWIDLVGTRTYGENIRWNKRLLLMLERAGLLEFKDLELRRAESPEEDPEEWATVKVHFPPHALDMAARIEDKRAEEKAYFHDGLSKLDDFIEGAKCAARVIGNLYDISSHQRSCPGCPLCRSQHKLPLDCEPLDFPPIPPYSKPIASVLVEGCPQPVGHAGRADFAEMVSRCVTLKGLRQFHCPDQSFEPILGCFREALPLNSAELHRLDSIRAESKLSSAATLPLVFFHVGNVSNAALALGRPFPSVHLFCGVQNPCDHNGRHISVNEKFRRWPSLDSWIAKSPESSLPCLPMTL